MARVFPARSGADLVQRGSTTPAVAWILPGFALRSPTTMSSNSLSPKGPPHTTALTLQQARMLQANQQAREEADATPGDDVNLKEIFRAIAKHKWMIAGITLLCLAAASVYTLRITPMYRSTTLIQIDRSAQKVVGFNTEVELDQGTASDQLLLRTQIELLKSRSLALRVIDEMGLYKPVDGQGQGDTPSATPAPESRTSTQSC